MYDLTTEPQRRFVRVRLSGFLSTNDVENFARAKQQAVAAMGCNANDHLMLVDISGCLLQTQDVVAAFRDIIDSPRGKAKRLAVVTGKSLARRQVNRIMMRNEAMIFETTAMAEAWLFADIEPRRTQQAA